MSLSRAEKERILRALEEDREFRYALMGLLGFREVLERITRLEERFSRLEERQLRLEERQQRLEEEFRRLEERFAQLEERFAKLEERVARLEEGQRELRERQDRLEERMDNLWRLVVSLAHRLGVVSEETLREAFRAVVEEELGAGRVERWVTRDEEGIVYGHPAVVEADLLIRDGAHILVEIKSRVSRADVAELYRIGLLYERKQGVKPRLVAIGGLVDPDAERLARELGVRIVPAARPPAG